MLFLHPPPERRNQLRDALAEIDRQASDRADLDHNGIHLPVAALQTDMQQGLGDAQMRRGADRQKLCQPLNNSQNHRHQVIVQSSSSTFPAYTTPREVLRLLRNSGSRLLLRLEEWGGACASRKRHAAQIIALHHTFDTIAVPLPEGNRRLIIHRRFQQHGVHALSAQYYFPWRSAASIQCRFGDGPRQHPA